MKIITWNMYNKNKRIPEAIDFLKQQDADIICLQELPQQHAPLLEKLGMHIMLNEEIMRFRNPKKATEKLYMVIASKFPIVNQKIVPHQYHYEHVSGFDTTYADYKADSQFIEVDAPQGKFRIFNTHFKCEAGPYHRLSQFREVVESLSRERMNIICGDFNTFGKPFLNLFVWKYFGYKLHEIHIHERNILHALLDLYQLKNPFRRTITFWKVPNQLDYILIPLHLTVVQQKRLGLNGSDHFPLLLEIA